MKEILESILKVEEESGTRVKNAETESQNIMNEAKQKAAIMEKELEARIQKERDDSIKILMDEAKKYEIELKEKYNNEAQQREKKLAQKKDQIKEQMLKMILG